MWGGGCVCVGRRALADTRCGGQGAPMRLAGCGAPEEKGGRGGRAAASSEAGACPQQTMDR